MNPRGANWGDQLIKTGKLPKKGLRYIGDTVVRTADKMGIKDDLKYLQPCYKIMITIPSFRGNKITPHRYIIADTSSITSKESPILGLWVDLTDRNDPDKAIVLLHDPMKTTGLLQEPDIINFEQYGIRNWIDIWMGYKKVVGGTVLNLAEVLKANPLGGKMPRQLIDVSGKYAWTYPDPFFFGNLSHVFSGVIVSSRRLMSSKGDRLQMVGFSPTVSLKSVSAANVRFTAGQTLGEVVMGVAKSIGTIPDYRSTDIYPEVSNDKFYMGQFDYHMFMNGKGDSGRLRVSPFYRSEYHDSLVSDRSNIINDLKYPYHIRKGWDVDSVRKKMNPKVGSVTDNPELKVGQLSQNIEGDHSLYELLFDVITNPFYHRLTGLYARIVYNHSVNAEEAFTEGYGHPGVTIAYGYRHETDGIRELINAKQYPDYLHQTLTLGHDARELELGIEYGTVFNAKKFIMKRRDNPTDAHPTGVPRTVYAVFPTGKDFFDTVKYSYFYNSPDGKFTHDLLRDIYIYGQTTLPTDEWLWTENDKPSDDKAWQSMAVRSMRESYYAGMSGSLFAVGRPELKPYRSLSIADERGSSNKFIPKVVEETYSDIKRKIWNKDKPTVPQALRHKDHEKDYYIWKVRHYIGKGSGYVTKVYITEERNTTWKQYTPSVDSQIKAALAQAHEFSKVL